MNIRNGEPHWRDIRLSDPNHSGVDQIAQNLWEQDVFKKGRLCRIFGYPNAEGCVHQD